MGYYLRKNAFCSRYREELRRKPFSFLISFCAILFFIVFLSARHSAGVVPPNEKRLVCQDVPLRPPFLFTSPVCWEFHFMFHPTIRHPRLIPSAMAEWS